METGKTGKYFKYAIGEIILVVIGILIALQINNWNENRKASNEELNILIALQSDFLISKNRIQETIKVQTNAMRHSEELIKIYERQNKMEFEYFDTHLDSLDYLISYGGSWYRAEPITGAYNSLISAGKIDLIQNQDLRQLLAQFIADFESGFEDQDTAMSLLDVLNKETTHFVLKIASNKFRERFNFEPRRVNELNIAASFFSNDAFFGNLYLKSALEYNRIIRQNELLNQTNSILNLINQELKIKSN
ncbi:DUF6090 family protein [Psychroserpens sp. Hel_I_66]|uniref:DUF6090 family protein n=1 Tax=Psychroserpens sp. Hel_I_66 TaxID=1250004 RepID=UPI00068D6AF5|nr:DUF6090 family protein [Psychroserpens sp. Hel_I_66]